MRLRFRIARLEKMVRQFEPSLVLWERGQREQWERIANHPEGPDVASELWEMVTREAANLPAGFDQGLVWQRLLLDERGRELAACLADIVGGLTISTTAIPGKNHTRRQ
jgi:hypothetical protein